MEQKKIRVLHVVRDDKFIEGPLKYFDEDGRFENHCIMIVEDANYQFRYINNPSRIKLIYNKQMLKRVLQNYEYDAIYFFALTDYHIFKYIPHDKIVIWWAWGYDIYGPERFIDIPLYKPLTKKIIKQTSSIADKLLSLIKKIPFVLDLRDGNRNQAIKRIDFFQPVIHTEYLLMKKVRGFKAHEFHSPRCKSGSPFSQNDEIPSHNGSILIGHSATFTNNHIDVWNTIKEFIPKGRTVFFPVNYGVSEYAEYLAKTISSSTIDIVFIKEFLAKEKYFEIVDSCSYAVFGVIREQAIANMFRCLANGVKLFLYKDSIPYQYFTSLGFVVFSIDDIDEHSFQIPLTREQALLNRGCVVKESEMRNRVSEQSIIELLTMLNQRKNVDTTELLQK